MILETESGTVSVNKRSPRGKLLMGWLSTGAFSGALTLRKIMGMAEMINTDKKNWYQLGVMLGNMYNNDLLKL